jgi:hypothetical protein
MSVTEMGRQAIRVTRIGFPVGQAVGQPVS